MELDEFHVRYPAAGAPRHRDAVAGRGVGVGRVEIDLSCAASGDQCGLRTDGQYLARLGVECIGAEAAISPHAQFFGRNEIDRDVVFEQGDVRMCNQLLRQGLLDGRPGRIRDMDDATGAMAAFSGQVIPVRRTRERHPLFDQPFNRAPPVLDDKAGRRRVVEMGTGIKGVANMGFDGIPAIEYGGNTPLRPGRGTDFDAAFADDGNTLRGGKPKSGRLTGQSATDDKDVEMA